MVHIALKRRAPVSLSEAAENFAILLACAVLALRSCIMDAFEVHMNCMTHGIAQCRRRQRNREKVLGQGC